jgi:hypothetical protein
MPTPQEREEAKRLAELPARERKAALSVHWNIANNASLSETTRDYARRLAETLESLIKHIQKRERR